MDILDKLIWIVIGLILGMPLNFYINVKTKSVEGWVAKRKAKSKLKRYETLFAEYLRVKTYHDNPQILFYDVVYKFGRIIRPTVTFILLIAMLCLVSVTSSGEVGNTTSPNIAWMSAFSKVFMLIVSIVGFFLIQHWLDKDLTTLSILIRDANNLILFNDYEKKVLAEIEILSNDTQVSEAIVAREGKK